MSNKRFDFSVLPNGFLCEFWEDHQQFKQLGLILEVQAGALQFKAQGCDHIWYDNCRPALNHWHFNDGSMVLPDGLVFIASWQSEDGDRSEAQGYTDDGLLFLDNGKCWHEIPQKLKDKRIVGVMITNATQWYEENAKELGIEVIEI